MKNKIKLTYLIRYYGCLQILHLATLVRAGLLILTGNNAPFPIFPPPGGWEPQTLPFMIGLACMDILAIILALVFAYQTLIKDQFHRRTGILSLVIAFSGAIVFAAGTFPTGAWSAHPFSYWLMVVLFIPAGWLLLRLLNGASPSLNKKISK